MSDDPNRSNESLSHAAEGSKTVRIQESARGASFVQDIAEPTTGPAGGSGASDAPTNGQVASE